MTLSESDKDPYILKNSTDGAGPMLAHLANVLDEITTVRLAEAGIYPGDSCLELGAGLGTIAAWMAEQVGQSGNVIAADIDPRHIDVPGSVSVMTLNVVTDEIPPAKRIHARCLLAHLPTREDVMAALVRAVDDGGWLCVEEWGQYGTGYIAVAPDPMVPDIYNRYSQALQTVFLRRGNDTSWCRRVPQVMRRHGLTNIQQYVQARSWQGGSPGCLLPIAVSRQLEDELIGTGMVTGTDLAHLRVALLDPNVTLVANALHSTIGFRARRDV